jgi:hypothetical protein
MFSHAESILVRVDPPLPCCTVGPNGKDICGKPAKAGWADRFGQGYLLMPICRDCTAAMARLYGLTGEEPSHDQPG